VHLRDNSDQNIKVFRLFWWIIMAVYNQGFLLHLDACCQADFITFGALWSLNGGGNTLWSWRTQFVFLWYFILKILPLNDTSVPESVLLCLSLSFSFLEESFFPFISLALTNVRQTSHGGGENNEEPLMHNICVCQSQLKEEERKEKKKKKEIDWFHCCEFQCINEQRQLRLAGTMKLIGEMWS